MTVRILEVESPSATACVYPTVGMTVWAAAVRDSFRFYATVECIELRVTDVEGIMMALRKLGIESRRSPFFRPVGESERQSLVDLYLRKVPLPRHFQAEHFRKKLRRCDLVFCRYDRMVQPNRHIHPL